MIGKYVNIIPNQIPHIINCIENRLWLKMQRAWWSPCEFVTKFGVVWINPFLDSVELKSPYDLLKEAEDVINRKSELSAGEDELMTLNARYRDFKNKVDEYYSGDWDQRLKKSIETNVWQ